METTVIVINGSGGVGKSTFVELCCELNPKVCEISTVDYVKQMAKLWGWNGAKTPENRKFLSDLKDLLEQWGNVPNKKVEEYIDFIDKTIPSASVFIHAREPHNIQYYKDKYNAITVLVTNDRIEQVTSNHADMEVYDFTYDYIIENNGDLEQLKESAETFMYLNGLEK